MPAKKSKAGAAKAAFAGMVGKMNEIGRILPGFGPSRGE
jgi:hypothetical protein